MEGLGEEGLVKEGLVDSWKGLGKKGLWKGLGKKGLWKKGLRKGLGNKGFWEIKLYPLWEKEEIFIESLSLIIKQTVHEFNKVFMNALFQLISRP